MTRHIRIVGILIVTVFFFYPHSHSFSQTPPFTGMTLTSLCTYENSSLHKMRMRNPNSYDISFTWVKYGSSTNGSGTAIANSDTCFNTPDFSTIVVNYTVDGTAHSTVKAQNTSTCSADMPTDTRCTPPTPTNTPAPQTPTSPTESDSPAPTLSLSSSPQNPTNSTTLNFTGTSDITSGNISLVEYSIDDENTWSDATATDGTYNSNSESFTFKTRQLSEGDHIITIRAKSSAGIYTRSDQYSRQTIKIVTSAPSVVLTPFSPNPTNSLSPTTSATAFSLYTTIKTVEASFDNGKSWTSLSASKELYTNSLVFPSEGSYSVIAKATDAAGNTTLSKPQLLTIVTSPPTIIFPPLNPNPTKNQSPAISAQALSKFGQITKVELSSDSGNTWKTMDKNGNDYIFKFSNLEDGNYPLIVRAFDNATNTALSETQTLIIDTIPPIIGGSFVSLGNTTLIPDDLGVIRIATNTEWDYLVSMKGGTTDAFIDSGSNSNTPLTKQPGTNLWSGKLSYPTDGEFNINVIATDGANNKTTRKTVTVIVDPPGEVVNKTTLNPVEDATVTLYQYQPTTTTWAPWDAATFGQKNPIEYKNTNQYGFLPTAGTYYLETKAPGFQTTQSDIFTLTDPTTINFTFPIRQKFSLQFRLPLLGKITLALPTLIPDTINIRDLSKPTLTAPKEPVGLYSGIQAPDFVLPNTSSKLIKLSDYRGKKVLLSFIASWSPPSLDQARVLSELNSKLPADQVILVIALQESVPTADSFLKRSSYTFPLLADSNGETANLYAISTLPQMYFIDKFGVIKNSTSKILNETQLQEQLNSLP